MPITIHGKEYITVAERVKMLHEREDLKGKFSIETELIATEPAVTIRARVQINDQIFTGISAANPNKTIEKQSPYEVAETSAIGRALGFAGFGIIDGIATADEMIKAELSNNSERPAKTHFRQSRSINEYESGQFCQKCNAAALVTRLSTSTANPDKAYYYCQAHKGFSHWVETSDVAATT